jgi:hypothetical protein
MRSLSVRLILCIVAITSVISGSAGQSTEPQVARGAPEHLLSGVDIFGSIKQVVARYGRPTRVEESPVPHGAPGAGLRDYMWVMPRATLDVRTGHYVDPKTGEEVETNIYSVEVTGTKALKDIGVTGAGLSLGDNFDKARHVYGPYFFWRALPDGLRLIVIEWENKTTLAITLDSKGRINRIILEPSEA